MPAYFYVERYLYEPVIHISHPGFQENFLSWFPHPRVVTLPYGISVKCSLFLILFQEEFIITSFVLVSCPSLGIVITKISADPGTRP